ncbi:hypothetical protein B7494_g3789 [Chlorociboria aeruginascens]|nr:hypothetical protein B7494_g3789 [Chlorociboria aeruginascens]
MAASPISETPLSPPSKPKSNSKLAPSDIAILSQIFDPESAPSSQSLINPSLPADPQIPSHVLSELKATEVSAIRPIESSSSSLSEDQKDELFETSYGILSELIERHPSYASAYNNRAQLVRWRFGEGIFVPGEGGNEERERLGTVMQDLERAIALASTSRERGEGVSQEQARVLSQAYVQRGLVYLGLAKRLKGPGEGRSSEGMDAERLEEKAGRDFGIGGKYGSLVGRQMSVHLNPYAKMCGGIVREALRKEMLGLDE